MTSSRQVRSEPFAFLGSSILQKSRLFNAPRVWILLQISKRRLQSESLSIPLADCEVAIEEELSKAMAEGFSAALDEVIENFDKSDGISAVIDEYFQKSDEPDKNLWSDEVRMWYVGLGER